MAKSVKFTDSVSHISNKAPAEIDEEDDVEDGEEEELVPMKAATNFKINDDSDDELEQINSSVNLKPPIQPSPLKKKDSVAKIEKVSPLKKKVSVPKMASIDESIVMPTPHVKSDKIIGINK